MWKTTTIKNKMNTPNYETAPSAPSSLECDHTVITCYDDEVISIPPKMTTFGSLPSARFQKQQTKNRTVRRIILASLFVVLLVFAYGAAFVNFSMHLFKLETEHDREKANLRQQRNEMWRAYYDERMKIDNFMATVENFDQEFAEN